MACNSERRNEVTKPGYEHIFSGRPDPLEQDFFIKRYNGSLGPNDSIPLNMLLVNWGNGHLSGNIQYENHLGLLKFEGNINPDGEFLLTEERFSAPNATFSGSLQSTDVLTGQWYNIDSTKSLPFEFSLQAPLTHPADWAGAWHLNDPWDTATLIIGGVLDHQFEFALTMYINGYHDMYFGTADIVDDTLAFVDYLDDDIHMENCKLVFHRRGHEVYLEQQSFPFLCGLNFNCWIEGSYKDIYTGKIPKMENFIGPKTIFRDTSLYDTFLEVVGLDNEPWFAYSMEKINYTNAWEEFHGLEGSIFAGRVRGFHREKEAVIAYDLKGNMWAAVTTPPDYAMGPMSIHYFTNARQWKNRLHPAVKDWKKEFRNCSVVYESGKDNKSKPQAAKH